MNPELPKANPARPADPEGTIAVLLDSVPEPLPKRETLAPAKPTRNAGRHLPGSGPWALAPWNLPATVGPFLAKSLENRWRSYRQGLRRCQRDFSEETVHEFRVATRRLIAQLVLIECVAPRTTVHRTRRLLKRRLKALGELRDTHVQLLFIERRLPRYPELMLVRDFLRRRERRLEKSSAAKVKRFKTRKLAKCVSAMGQHLANDLELNQDLNLNGNPARARRLAHLADALARATRHAFAEVVYRRRKISPSVPSTVHRTRIAFKKFRYMMEALSPAYTGLNKEDLRRLAQYQRRMGILQDLEVIQQCVARFTKKNRGMEALLQPFGGYLRARRARALRCFLKSADDLFTFWPPTREKTNGHVAAAALSAA